MKRTQFVQHVLGLGLLSFLGCQFNENKSASALPVKEEVGLEKPKADHKLRKELLAAWNRSENMTLIKCEPNAPGTVHI